MSRPARDAHHEHSVGALEAEQLLAWAKGIARGVRSDTKPPLRAGSAEEEELEGVAVEALVELLHRFDEMRVRDGDPVKMFTRTFGQEIRSRCRRAATALRHGGTGGKGSSKGSQKVRVRPLPMTADGSDVALPGEWGDPADIAAAREGGAEDGEPVTSKYEPKLLVVRNGIPVERLGEAG